MSDTPFTNRKTYSNGGPLDSQNFNSWSEESYKDLVYLYNSSGQMRVDVESSSSIFYKEVLAMSNELGRLGDRLAALEDADSVMVYNIRDQIDNDRFDDTPFEIPVIARNSFDSTSGLITLPKVVESSVSKIRFINQDGTFNVANGLEVVVEQIEASLDNSMANMQLSSAYDAIQNRPGRVWERNITSDSVNENGVECHLFVRIPNELSATGDTNSISFSPFPIFDIDIMDVSYSIDPNVALTSTSTWTPLNESDWYNGNQAAVGKVPPGAWAGDEIMNSSHNMFYFAPKAITAIHIRLRQNSYIERANNYIYSYGLSSLDVRYDKFTKQGRCMVRFDAPDGETISGIVSINPNIWNVQQAAVDDVFSYRAVWETAYNSGIYTLNPVSLSQRVWVEVTLDELNSGYTPAISSMSLSYT